MSKTWIFNYRSMAAMTEANPEYNPTSGVELVICDSETFESKSSDFLEACKVFDEFSRNVKMWDVAPEASFNNGECYKNIKGVVTYNEFL